MSGFQRDHGQMQHRAWSALAPAVLAGVLLIAFGCRHRAEAPALDLDLPETFSRSGSERVPDRWWTAFDDPELDALVARSLHGNLDLAGAWQRLLAARAAWERTAAARWPELDGEAEATLQRGDRGESERLALGLAASYELDLWGRIAALAAAERHRAEASLADYRTLAVTLSAEVADTWYRLRETRAQQVLVARQIATNESVLALLRERFGGGQVRHVDLTRQRQLLSATREEAALVAAQRALLEHRLALLQGRAPSTQESRDPIEGAVASLPELPPLPATGLPAELVRRRPDVQRAHRLLAAANRELAAAISDQYPRISLSASAATVADRPEDLFRDWIYTLAGNLLAPLVDGGARAAEVRRREALERERLLAYAEAILTAFREVEDALAEERWSRERIASLERQLELAQAATDELGTAYRNGVADYIEVLIALRESQALQRELLVARRVLVGHRIALYRALAGGFATPREADPAQRLIAVEGEDREGTDEP